MSSEFEDYLLVAAFSSIYLFTLCSYCHFMTSVINNFCIKVDKSLINYSSLSAAVTALTITLNLLPQS